MTAGRVFYVQVRDCYAMVELEAMEARLRVLARVTARGLAPASDPSGAWFELVLKTPEPDVALLRERLAGCGVPESRIARVLEIPGGEGRTQSKQLSLFEGV